MGTAVGKEKKDYEDSLRSQEGDASSAAAEAAELAAQAEAAKLKAQASLKRLDAAAAANGTSGTRQAPPDAPPSPPPSPSSGDVNAAVEAHDYNAPENQPAGLTC